jgi:hypothetical protein
LLQVGRYAYARTERGLYVNLFIGGAARVSFPSGEVTLRVETDYPWDGRVRYRIETASPVRFALYVRKPGWCDRADLTLNGAAVTTTPDEAGFWRLEREWRDGDSLQLLLDMPVRRMMAHPNIASCRGKVALQRGPLIYGFEGHDNRGNPRVTLGPDPEFTVERRPDLLGGVRVVHSLSADGQPIRALPFYALANRGRSAQEVWVEQAGLKPTSDWWLGALYRPVPEGVGQ